MKQTSVRFLLQIVILICACIQAAQSQTIELRSTGEHRIATGETPKVASQLALLEARRGVMKAVAARLRDSAAIQAIPFKPNQMDALIPALTAVQVVSAPSETAPAGSIYRTTVLVRFNAVEFPRVLDKVRKDPETSQGLMEIWKQSELAHQRLEKLAAGDPTFAKDQESLIRELLVKDLVAQSLGSLGKIEESPGSKRVSSLKGRQRAIQLAEIAVVMGPDFPETHTAMGDALVDSNQLPEAAENEYRQALLLTPGSTSIRIKLANALRLEEKLPESIAELRDVLRTDPGSAAAHIDLGFVLQAQQKHSEAIEEAREAIRLDPDSVDAHNNLAISLARMGQIPDAVAEFREIVRIDPESVLGYYNMGIALADMEKDAESAEAFRQAVRINPKHYNSHFNMGELFRLEGKFDDAVKQFREYLKWAPDTPQSQRNIQRAKEFVQTHENQ